MISESDDPAAIIGALMAAVPPGSTLAISHVPNDMHMGAMSDMSERLSRLLSQPSTYRSRAQVNGFFDGLELVEPGVVPIQQWRPDTPGGGRGGRRDVGRRRRQAVELSPRERIPPRGRRGERGSVQGRRGQTGIAAKAGAHADGAIVVDPGIADDARRWLIQLPADALVPYRGPVPAPKAPERNVVTPVGGGIAVAPPPDAGTPGGTP